MTWDELVRMAGLSAAVFFPVAILTSLIGFVVTRFVGHVEARRARWLVLGASVAVAATATALVWVGEEMAATVTRLLVSVATALGVYLCVLALTGVVNRRIHNDVARFKTRKALVYVGTLIVVLTLLRVWVFRQTLDYTTIFSVLGAGIALALHQVLICFTGWLTLLFRRHYDVGDRVQIGDVKGDVSDVGVLHTTLLELGGWVGADQSTGRLVTVPNSSIFTQPIFNYNRGFQFIWNELNVLVTFESNWRKAQEIMLASAQVGLEEIEAKFRAQIHHMAKKYMVLYQHLTPIVYPSILDSGVQLTLRYLTDPKRRRTTEAALTAKILDGFAQESDIDFAYPTTRFYDATREGKAAQAGPP